VGVADLTDEAQAEAAFSRLDKLGAGGRRRRERTALR
jgi:hypothetical protein